MLAGKARRLLTHRRAEQPLLTRREAALRDTSRAKSSFYIVHWNVLISWGDGAHYITVSRGVASTVASAMWGGLRLSHWAGMRPAFSTSECGLSDRISNVSSMTLGHSCSPFTPDQILSDRLLQQGLSAFRCVKHLNLIKRVLNNFCVSCLRLRLVEEGERGGRKSRFYPRKWNWPGESLHRSRKTLRLKLRFNSISWLLE